MIQEEEPLFERGVWYCRQRWPNLHPLPKGFTEKITYRWVSPSGKTGTSVIWVQPESRKYLRGLMEHWSRNSWHYEIKESYSRVRVHDIFTPRESPTT